MASASRHAASPLFLSPLEIDKKNADVGPCASQTGQRCSDKGFLSMSLASYLELLDWTACQFVAGEQGVTPQSSPAVFARLKIREEVWFELVSDFGRFFLRDCWSAAPH